MIAFVTGASSGIGDAIVRRLLSEGHLVVGVARRGARLKKLSDEFQNRFFALELDVSNKEDVAKSLSKLPAEFSSIDILVNNAGLALGLELAQDADLNDWEQMIDVNIRGLLFCTHAILPGMVERGRGQIINMGSVAGEYPYPGGNIYGATKAFVRQLSLNLRADLLGTCIRVTDIEPGMVGGTEFSDVRFRGNSSQAKKVYEGANPLLPEDIAETVSWILNLPTRMNVNTISLMPVSQAFAPLAVARK